MLSQETVPITEDGELASEVKAQIDKERQKDRSAPLDLDITVEDVTVP